MDHLYYQKKINDVITKCPIEAGVEILVYNLLDESVDIEQYSLVDINRIPKKQDTRLSTEVAVSDIAILSPDFKFKEKDTGKVYGFVEVKAAGISLRITERISKQMEKATHFIYTNGIVWKYYINQKLEWEKNLGMDKTPYSKVKITVLQKEFEEIKQAIQEIKWNESPDKNSSIQSCT